jgi:hypothetical protein
MKSPAWARGARAALAAFLSCQPSIRAPFHPSLLPLVRSLSRSPCRRPRQIRQATPSATRDRNCSGSRARPRSPRPASSSCRPRKKAACACPASRSGSGQSCVLSLAHSFLAESSRPRHRALGPLREARGLARTASSGRRGCAGSSPRPTSSASHCSLDWSPGLRRLSLRLGRSRGRVVWSGSLQAAIGQLEAPRGWDVVRASINFSPSSAPRLRLLSLWPAWPLTLLSSPEQKGFPY